MKLKFRKFFIAIALVLSLITYNLNAKPTGGFSGGSKPSSSFSKPSSSKSSGGFSSSSKSSSKPSSSWSSKSPSSSSKSSSSSSSWDSTKSKQNGFSSAKTTPSVDKNTYNAAKQSGTVFTDKNAAAAAFKEKNSQKYTSTFKTEPKARPTYIPSTYREGNNNYNITYNVGHGGYGYTNTLGLWIAYDIMRDSQMRDRVMVENHYYTTSDEPIVYTSNENGGFFKFLLFGIVFGFIIFIFVTVVLRVNR